MFGSFNNIVASGLVATSLGLLKLQQPQQKRGPYFRDESDPYLYIARVKHENNKMYPVRFI